MAQPVVIDERDIAITPVFTFKEIENIPKSESSGFPVMEVIEGVEVRFAGSKTYSPFFPADAFSHREGNQTYTYAERWPEQYRAFKEGNPQEAQGTPLQMLQPFGITPEQMSLCRALRIYSIEALHQLEGQGVKSLGMNANRLKEAAAAFMADRDKAKNSFAEVEALKARIAELEARSTLPPVPDMTPSEIAQTLSNADDRATIDLTDEQVKARIAELTGARPRGNPNSATLRQMLAELEARPVAA